MLGVENADAFGVVIGFWRAFAGSDVYRGYGLTPRVAARARVDAEQRTQFDMKGSFLERLADCRSLDRFADIDKTTGYGPAERKIFALDQNDASI